MNAKKLLEEAVSLPVEERTLIVDTLLKSLNQPESEIDEAWTKKAQKRLHELESAQLDAISGDEVFEKIWSKFDQ